jgi:hypothetical protein
MRHLLVSDRVTTHELVYGELLIGDIGGRIKLLENLALRPFLPKVPHEEVVELVRSRRLQGRGAGWIDIHLLVSAMVAKTPLWTADPRCEALARECGIAYDVTK